jgi:hypothetical protein
LTICALDLSSQSLSSLENSFFFYFLLLNCIYFYALFKILGDIKIISLLVMFLVESGFLNFSTIGECKVSYFRFLLAPPLIYVAMIVYNLGCMRISSILGLFWGSGSIMRLISCSNWADLLALGEN